jgi:hypothetical protein
MFWRKKTTVEPQKDNLILAMVMLPEQNTFNVDLFTNDLKNIAGITVQDPAGDKESFSGKVQDETVMVAHMPAPIPASDLWAAAQYAYHWTTALEEIGKHKSHLIVSMMRSPTNQVRRYKIFSEIICAILRTTDAIGVYKGGQSLLIAAEQYLETVKYADDDLPINLWIYFGLIEADSGNSGYTYGLKQFDKPEMEIVDTGESLEDIRELLFNITYYVVENDITFRDGETCGLSQEQKINISYSKGKFLDEDTFKLAL